MPPTVTPDVNVLIAASRGDHPHHPVALAWLESAVASCVSGASLKLMPMVVASFLRLVTHPRIFMQPTPPANAVGFIDALLAVPGVEIPEIGREWPLLRQVCLDKKLTANAIPDAWLAVVVTQLGERLVTFDADFKKLLGRSQLTLLHPQ